LTDMLRAQEEELHLETKMLEEAAAAAAAAAEEERKAAAQRVCPLCPGAC